MIPYTFKIGYLSGLFFGVGLTLLILKYWGGVFPLLIGAYYHHRCVKVFEEIHLIRPKEVNE